MDSPGRNDPCPCGSGLKFKKCCMGKLSANQDLAVRKTGAPVRDTSAASAAPVSDLLLQAVALHQAGRLEEARTIYQRLLQRNPYDSHALHYLGLIAMQQKQFTEAAALIARAIQADGRVPAFHCNLGNAYKELRQFELAAAAFHEAVRLDPQFHVAYYNLGNTCLAQGKPEEACDSYRMALQLDPALAEAHFGLGNALMQRHAWHEADASFRRAVSLRPNYAEAYCNLGICLGGQGSLDEAAACFAQALSIRPDFAEAHFHLGNIRQKLGRPEAAIECFQQALALKPDYAEACNNLGSILQRQGKLEPAIALYRQALALQPDFSAVRNNLGTALQDQGKLEDAIACYEQALSLKPDLALAYSNLLYLHSFTRDISPEAECALAAGWETAMLDAGERQAARDRATSFAYPPLAGRKLRLGIVSAELGQTAVADFLEPVLEQLDRSRFHVSLFPTATRTEARAERFSKLADAYTSLVGYSDSEAAERIRSERIDVLLDTSGHMRDNRLGIFAHRAAPVQCHYIGYHGTTGLTEMDWFIGDDELLPASCAPHFREKIWRLPRLWVAYRGDTTLPESKWQPAADGTVWLGSFNNLTKVREASLSLWASVMSAIPASRLLLKDSRTADPAVQARIRNGLEGHGIDGERIEFAPWVAGWQAHMALYDRLDIALDTLPLNSGTTAFDALWMGVPLVALEGDWMGGRMTATMLRALGKPEWIARNKEEYANIVTALARDVKGRMPLRAMQRSLMASSQLCDATGLARSLEEAYEGMYDMSMNI